MERASFDVRISVSNTRQVWWGAPDPPDSPPPDTQLVFPSAALEAQCRAVSSFVFATEWTIMGYGSERPAAHIHQKLNQVTPSFWFDC